MQDTQVTIDGMRRDEDAEMQFREPQSIVDLPPMPTPNYAAMRSESSTGVTVVLVLISLLVGIPHAVRFGAGWSWPATGEAWDATATGFVCLYAEATVALLCLLGLMFGDPGALKRTPARCFPIPTVVADRIRSGQSLAGLDNVYEDGRVYCIRCCIWRDGRRPSSMYERVEHVHHCSICQRCVCHFDHHCGVFGRCIAGNGCGGNMGYFKCILLMAFAGFMTCFITVLAGSNE